jgi:plastocyanin
MKVRKLLTASTWVALAFSLPATAGPDKIAYPADYNKGVLYGTVDRYDTKQYRELWASKAAVDAVKAGKPIPHGTVLTMIIFKAKVDAAGNPVKDANGRFQKGDPVMHMAMQKGAGWGTEYDAAMRNGEWEYRAFLPDGKPNEKADLKPCFACHKPHAGQDFVISLARLSGTAPGAKVDAPKGANSVAISSFLFGPEKLDVKPNTYVTFTNTDDSPHQVTIAGPGGLRTPVILKGQSTTLKFEAPGTYDYICGLHTGMKGKIEVK